MKFREEKRVRRMLMMTNGGGNGERRLKRERMVSQNLKF